MIPFKDVIPLYLKSSFQVHGLVKLMNMSAVGTKVTTIIRFVCVPLRPAIRDWIVESLLQPTSFLMKVTKYIAVSRISIYF